MDCILLRADSLLEVDPLLSYSMLDSVFLPESYPENEFAYWCLLINSSKDKAFLKHENDSLIKLAVKYYRNHVDSMKLAQALYTYGRIQVELGNPVKAGTAFMEAIELANCLHDYELSYKACSQLGTIYLYQDMVATAEPLLQSALIAAQLTGKSTYCSYANSYLGRLYGLKHQFSTAVDYYKTAIRVATPYSSAWQLAIRELGGMYCLSKSPQVAFNFLDSCALDM